eukprot:2135297-Ditylum_brightwellii.AAC.1
MSRTANKMYWNVSQGCKMHPGEGLFHPQNRICPQRQKLPRDGFLQLDNFPPKILNNNSWEKKKEKYTYNKEPIPNDAFGK